MGVCSIPNVVCQFGETIRWQKFCARDDLIIPLNHTHLTLVMYLVTVGREEVISGHKAWNFPGIEWKLIFLPDHSTLPSPPYPIPPSTSEPPIRWARYLWWKWYPSSRNLCPISCHCCHNHLLHILPWDPNADTHPIGSCSSSQDDSGRRGIHGASLFASHTCTCWMWASKCFWDRNGTCVQ